MRSDSRRNSHAVVHTVTRAGRRRHLEVLEVRGGQEVVRREVRLGMEGARQKHVGCMPKTRVGCMLDSRSMLVLGRPSRTQQTRCTFSDSGTRPLRTGRGRDARPVRARGGGGVGWGGAWMCSTLECETARDEMRSRSAGHCERERVCKVAGREGVQGGCCGRQQGERRASGLYRAGERERDVRPTFTRRGSGGATRPRKRALWHFRGGVGTCTPCEWKTERSIASFCARRAGESRASSSPRSFVSVRAACAPCPSWSEPNPNHPPSLLLPLPMSLLYTPSPHAAPTPPPSETAGQRTSY